MSAPIGPGDWVELIDPAWAGQTFPRQGGIYCIESVEDCGDNTCGDCGGSVGLDLVQVPPLEDCAWCPCQFRPIYRPRADLIEQLKQPAPPAVRELEDA
jgi:hypothetical protein